MSDNKCPELTVLRSDKQLRDKIEKLEIVNPSDKNAVDIFLNQKGFSAAQRIWMNSLISRGGEAFVLKNKK